MIDNVRGSGVHIIEGMSFVGRTIFIGIAYLYVKLHVQTVAKLDVHIVAYRDFTVRGIDHYTRLVQIPYRSKCLDTF